MVFGLFTRNSAPDISASPGNDQANRLPTPTPSVASAARHSPFRFPAVLRSALGGSTDSTLKESDQATESVVEGGNNDLSLAPPPPETPPPPPIADPNETKILYDLMSSIPPKTLHAYTLAHLRPQPLQPPTLPSPAPGSHPDNSLRPPSPNTVVKLTAFFSTLAPPPLLHCVRCHKDFHEIDNEEKDKACRVPHDDESTVVSRSSGGGHETLWGCCEQTTPGDGGEGPPDGWCYEGKHTTDVKRARFRADSTMHNDKLTSCLKLNCHGIRDRFPRPDSRASLSRNPGSSSARKSNPSPARSQVSAVKPHSERKRPRRSLKEAPGSENEIDRAESVAARATKAKGQGGAGGGAGGKDECGSMLVDESNSLSPESKEKPKPQSAVSRARTLSSTSTTSLQSSTHGLSSPKWTISTRATPAAKRRSISRALLSRRYSHVVSDSESSGYSRPRTRSYVREESLGGSAPKPTSSRTLLSQSYARRASNYSPPRTRSYVREGRAKKATERVSRSPTSEEEPETELEERSDLEERGRGRKRRRVERG